MKLWLISQSENVGYDTYDSAVVAAETEDDARKTDPSGEYGKKGSGGTPWFEPENEDEYYAYRDAWATILANVVVEYLGEAVPGTAAGVICAYYNAG